MIKTEELERLAVLARIKLSAEDKKSLSKEFDSILGYIDRLKKVNVSLDASARLGAVKNVMGLDTVENTGAEDRERLLNEAPDREGDFVAVKKIF